MRTIAAGLLLMLSLAAPGEACDLCAIWSSLQAKEMKTGPFVALFEQASSFGTLRQDGDRIPDGGQYLSSSITQAILGYQFSQRFGLQVNVPYVDRSFRRPEDGAMRRATVAGLGDVAALAKVLAAVKIRGDGLLAWSLLGGVKLPTGNSDRIGEELTEGMGGSGGLPPSGIHGHDLALGSGSTDLLFGSTLFWRYRRWFVNASAQYAWRRSGRFDYRIGDDFTWSVGPGGYVSLEHEGAIGLGLEASGEAKSEDALRGVRADDTAIHAIYLGPALTMAWGERIYGELHADFPLHQHNTGIQEVQDWRARLALSYRF